MNIILERINKIVLIKINRPDSLNALNKDTSHSLIEQMQRLDADENVGCFVITGDNKAFAAGADIKEMMDKSYMDVFSENMHAQWDKFNEIRTPKIAAVSGYALGGGCELAMMCDIIYAAKNAKFGQPEIKIGVIPGMGGTQRLTRLIGKSKAMDLILTGRFMDAEEAEKTGLVARIYDDDQLLIKSIEAAHQIASYSKPITVIAKEAVDQALETSLSQGIRFERRTYHALWATHDQKEGMKAFIEKRPPDFINC